MNLLALGIGSGIFFILGCFHGILALRDVFKPRTFTPTDDSVREAMTGVPIAINPKTDMWRAWLGFNLSHALGLLVFGGGLLSIAIFNPDLFAANLSLQVVAIVISTIYFVLSIRFWFSGPVIGSGISTACLIIASILS